MLIASEARSLAAVQCGELVRVDRVLFASLRDLCHRIGLAEGDRVRCRTSARSVLLLETEAGNRIVMDRDQARFISVVAAP